MNDNEIKKAFECCLKDICFECPLRDIPYAEDNDCILTLLRSTLDLINRQQAEIAKLEEYIDRCKSGEEYWVKCLLERPNEAVKEFAEELKKRASRTFMTTYQDGNEHITSYQFSPETIDNLVKEMVGDAE